jgi:hypothetical protein
MNANELAIELEHYLKGEEYDRLVWEIPDLLRQQQDEIEALKSKNKELEAFYRNVKARVDL